MMKYEFEERLNDIEGMKRTVTDEEYKLIEHVYAFHPSISETEGKRQVALLYHEFGIRIFKDMAETAERNRELEADIKRLEAEIDKASHELRDVLDQANALRRGE